MDEQQAERLARLAAKGRASKASAAPASSTGATIQSGAMPVTAPLAAIASFGPPDPSAMLAAAPVAPAAALVAAAAAPASGPAPTKRTTAPKGLPDGIESRPRSGRRKHVALAGRIMAAGLSTSTLFVGVASLAAAPAPSWEKKSADSSAGDVADASATDTAATVDDASLNSDYGTDADGTDTSVAAVASAAPDESIAAVPVETTVPVPETIVIVQKVPHYVFVDEAGNPIDDPSQASDPAQDAPQPKAAPRKSGGGGGGGGGGAAPAAADPTPQAAPAQQNPAPAQTAAPTPKQTAAPAPPKPAPAPTPKCTGSKCP